MSAGTEITTESGLSETQQFRSQVGHISRQSAAFFGGTIFTALLGYTFKVYLARVLGAENLGLQTLGMTLVGFVGVFNTLGLVESAVRFAGVFRARHQFLQLHALLWRGAGFLLAANVFFAAILLVGGRWVAIRFYHSRELPQYLPWFACLMLLGTLNTFYGKVLAGYKEVHRRTLIVNLVGSPVTMLGAVAFVSLGMGLRGYLSAQVVGACLVLVLLLFAVRELTPADARFSFRRPSSLGREVWSFSTVAMGSLALEFVMVQVDRIALGFFRGARDVGIYSVAAAFVAYVPVVLQSVNQIFSPTIADLHARGDHAVLARLFQSLTKWVIALTLPLASVILIFARPLMLIFGRDFEAGWTILIIGTLGQLVNCGVGSVGLLLWMSGNQHRLVRVQAAMVAILLAASVVFVPLWGIVGAALAAAIANVGVNVWNLLEVRRALGFSPYNRSYLRLLPPALAAMSVVLLLRRNAGIFHHDWLAVVVSLVLSYSVFGAIMLITGLNADDRLILSAIWLRVRSAFGKAAAGAKV